ncbi:MAG TPA: hypothetical protein VMO17_00750, partial [Terriglobia bacterium]|nr:hypothetical protein [Terriglobia bacterium]
MKELAFKQDHVAQRVRGAEWTNRIKQLFTSNPRATASLREIVDFFTAQEVFVAPHRIIDSHDPRAADSVY